MFSIPLGAWGRLRYLIMGYQGASIDLFFQLLKLIVVPIIPSNTLKLFSMVKSMLNNHINVNVLTCNDLH